MRILAIGDTNSLAETRRVLSRADFEMYRVPAALAAVRMVRQIPFDLMIVVHPLADTDFAGFHSEIRARASPCRVARRGDIFQGTIGNQTKHHGVPDINMTAKGAGQPDTVYRFNTHTVHQQPGSGV